MSWLTDWEGYNPLDFFLTFLTNNVLVATSVHEVFHLILLKLLGGDGYITVELLAFWMFPTVVVSEAGMIAVAFAGGLGVALLAFMYWFFSSDIEARIVWAAIGMAEFFYGLVEGILWTFGRMDLIWAIGLAAKIIPVVYVIATSKEMWKN